MSLPKWSSLDWRAICEQLIQRWQGSALPGFLTWWRRELAGCLPASLKRPFNAGALPQVLRWPLPDHACAGPERRVTLLLESTQVLECNVQLPRMPKHALAKVMAHEIDRYTPLTRDEVYFAVRALATMPLDSTMDVRLTVIPRIHLDGIVHQALGLGIEVTSIDILDSHGQPQGINLLPVSASAQQGLRTRAIRNGLLASSLMLVLACMSAWVERREQALEVRRTQLADIRAGAMQVDAMRKELQARNELEHVLRLHEAQRLKSVALLDLLSRCVPEHTWLDSLQVETDGQLVLSGSSVRASDLPAQMSECAGLLRAGLQGGIQPEPATGREHFTLHARLPGGD